MAHTSFVQPDDGNKHDETLMKLQLPKPLLPGEQLTLHIKFEVTLPHVFARMGVIGDEFVMAGQWFPKIAVYERKGTRDREQEGWSIHQYHGNSEFYANFGIYSVRIKVPRDYIVAATGFLTKKPAITGEEKTYHFYADDVHDFAWAASPNFVYVEQPFSTPDIPGVKIKLYLDPKHTHLKDRYLHAVQKSLARFGEWYGSYPYSSLSIVVPPEGGEARAAWSIRPLSTASAADEDEPSFELERVIAHEIAHQYFYGMVASNEFEEAWLDEAFTSYAEDKLMMVEYGLAPNLPIEASYVTAPSALQQNAWTYNSHAHYAENVYIRGKLVLRDIEQQLGEPLMNRVMKRYVQLWQFKHPTTRDFQTVLEEMTKRSWQPYFDDFIYGGGMVDYAVESIQTKEIKRGDALGGGMMYESNVLIRNKGPAHHPVTILFHFADGKSAKKIWDSGEPTANFKFVHETPVDWVMIDPDYALILENKNINNFLKTTLPRKTKLRWHLGAVKIIEALIEGVAW